MGRKPKKQDVQNSDLPEFSNDLESFLFSATGGKTKTLTHIYKLEKSGGRQKRLLIEELEDLAPTYSEIGTLYGSGDYEIIISWESDKEKNIKRGMKTHRFNLHSRWDEVKRKKDLEKSGNDPQLIQQINDTEQIKNGLGMMSQLMEIVKPLIQQNQQPQNNPMEMMQMVSQMSSQMLQNSFNQQLQTQKIMFKEMAEMKDQYIDEPQEEEEDSGINKIIDVISSILPMFLSAPAPVQNTMINQAKQNPEVKTLLKDSEKRQVLEKKLIKQYGKEKTKDLINKFMK